MTQGAHILVVDDEVNIRGALVTLLEKKGHRVRGAGTGEEALEELEAAPADLVMTDLKMPGIGGMEFLRRLKAKWPETEVVVMTAYGSIDTAVEAMRYGAYDYLTKPIDRERFPIVVEKALDRHALATENKQLKSRLDTFAENSLRCFSARTRSVISNARMHTPTIRPSDTTGLEFT